MRFSRINILIYCSSVIDLRQTNIYRRKTVIRLLFNWLTKLYQFPIPSEMLINILNEIKRRDSLDFVQNTKSFFFPSYFPCSGGLGEIWRYHCRRAIYLPLNSRLLQLHALLEHFITFKFQMPFPTNTNSASDWNPTRYLTVTNTRQRSQLNFVYEKV